MNIDKRLARSAAYWLQRREEQLIREFNPYGPALRYAWTSIDQAQFNAAYRAWLIEARMA